MSFIEKIFGSHSEREVKKLKFAVDKIEELSPAMEALKKGWLKVKL